MDKKLLTMLLGISQIINHKVRNRSSTVNNKAINQKHSTTDKINPTKLNLWWQWDMYFLAFMCMCLVYLCILLVSLLLSTHHQEQPDPIVGEILYQDSGYGSSTSNDELSDDDIENDSNSVQLENGISDNISDDEISNDSPVSDTASFASLRYSSESEEESNRDVDQHEDDCGDAMLFATEDGGGGGRNRYSVEVKNICSVTCTSSNITETRL